ncbi:chitin binding domain-containing protein [Xylariomycetidae sp. FL2044]|nr:chitin binding domain-containing protein [Xylariomycetidae sp. FL2044]
MSLTIKSTFSAAFGLVGLASTVAGHGFVTDPPARMPGDAMQSACGQQVTINQQSDNYGNVQGELQVASSQSDYKEAECDIWLCKGYKFADNQDNVQTLTAGQVLPITVDIRAPHTGVANVSIVSTSSNTVVGDPLISWDVYASTASTIPDDQKNFDITIPSDLGSECATAGDCVIQWYWFAEDIDQTYESCIDFTLQGDSGDSSSPAPTSAVGSSTTAAAGSSTTAVSSPATSSAAAQPTTAIAVEATTSAAPSATITGGAFIDAASIPSSLLTSTLPTAVPTGTGAPTHAVEDGTTVQDLVDWLNWAMSGTTQATEKRQAQRHARDFMRSYRH